MLRMTLGSIASIPDWIALANPDIPAQIHPKGGNKIEDNGRSHGKKTDINEILIYNFFVL